MACCSFPHFLGERTMGSMHSRGGSSACTSVQSFPHYDAPLLEGVAFDLKRTIDVLEADNVRAGSSIMSPVRPKARSESNQSGCYQKPVYTLQGNETASLVRPCLVGLPSGCFPRLPKQWMPLFSIKDIFEPNPCNKQLYEDLYHAFCQAHDAPSRYMNGSPFTIDMFRRSPPYLFFALKIRAASPACCPLSISQVRSFPSLRRASAATNSRNNGCALLGRLLNSG